jgi:hypothetical protein
MHQRRWVWALAAIAAIGIGVIGAVVWTGDDDDQDDESSTTSTSTDRSTTTTPTATSSTAAPDSTTTTAGESGAAPRRVDVVSAGPGGGSGEVVLNWDAVAGATGYRVLRASTPNGSFETVADLNVTTGSATAAPDVVNVWSEEHSYIPSAGALDAPDRSPEFQYIDVVTGAEQRCYRVVPYNAAGDGRASVVTCGAPP